MCKSLTLNWNWFGKLLQGSNQAVVIDCTYASLINVIFTWYVVNALLNSIPHPYI